MREILSQLLPKPCITPEEKVKNIKSMIAISFVLLFLVPVTFGLLLCIGIAAGLSLNVGAIMLIGSISAFIILMIGNIRALFRDLEEQRAELSAGSN